MRSFSSWLYRSLWILPLCLTLFLGGCSKEQTQRNDQPERVDEVYSIVVQVNGMYCALCSRNVERSFKELDEVEAVVASVSENRVRIKLKADKTLTKTRITNTIAEAGYEAESFLKYPGEPPEETEHEHP